MEPIKTQLMTLEQINQLLYLPLNNDFTSHFEKYENGVFVMDRNHEYTAFINSSNILYVVKIGGETWRDYISSKYKSKGGAMKIYEEKIDNLLIETREKSKSYLEKSNIVKCYKILGPNVSIYRLDDEESEIIAESEKQEKYKDRQNPSDEISYLGLRADEFETGYWNLD
jgi:hypothetical protein